ncbi:MAG TPA: tetratricopeptide repeat protein [Chloroflexia bacterium]|nr:tetratricopeptide repeat protein [Chloroflexia bacterium]
MNGVLPFGQWLKQQRRLLGLTQEQLAERTGCAFETIRKLEAGTRKPSRQMAEVLAKSIGVAPEDLPTIVEFARSGVPFLDGGQNSQVVHAGAGALPAQRTSFVGRDAEVNVVCDLLLHGNVRLLTLTGPPGIGKTRLGLQVAARLRDHFEDGVCFVPLSSTTDPDMVAPAIVAALGLKSMASGVPTAALMQYLQNKQTLLVLDNLEHLLPARGLLGDLITGCPTVTILTTSRTALRVYGEHQFPVPSLSLPDPALTGATELAQYEAVALFYHRARAVNPAFVLTEETTAVVSDICRQLDGLPLAIELAAARSKVLSPSSILARLGSRIRLLTNGGSDLPPRQQTLRGAIDWSHDLLSDKEKVLFRRMSVFSGGCTVDAIESVCLFPGEPNWDPFESLASLLNQSLVYRESANAAEDRYSMLWTIREYAQEKLTKSNELEEVQRLHASYFAALAEEAEPQLRSRDRLPWLARLDGELPNMRGALKWCLSSGGDIETGLRLSGALHWFWYYRGYMSEGLDWLERALSVATALRRTPAWAKAQGAAGRLALLKDDLPGALARLQESVAAWREVGDASGLAYALTDCGMARVYREREVTSDGHKLIEEAVGIFRKANDKWGLAYALDVRGDATFYLGGEERQIAMYKEESLALYRELRDDWGIAAELSELGHLAQRQGEYRAAGSLLAEALEMQQVVGDKWVMAQTIRSLGDVAAHHGDYGRATALYYESLMLCRELGDKLRASFALRSLGHLACDQGECDQAQALYRESLTLICDLGNVPNVALCLDALAGVAVKQAEVERAARLFGAAYELRRVSHGTIPPVDLARHERNLQALRKVETNGDVQAAWAGGRELTMAQAVAYALQNYTFGLL